MGTLMALRKALRSIRSGVALVLWVSAGFLHAQEALPVEQVDVVEFGQSRLVGEVKYLDRGKLYFKTDATDTIAINWADVKTLSTARHLRVERRNGKVGFGSFLPGAEDKRLAFNRGDDVEYAALEDVVAFEPIEATMWDRLDVSASLGYAFAKSTGVEQVDVALVLDHDSERRSRRLSIAGQSSKSSEQQRSMRRTIDYTTLRLTDSPFFWGWRSEYQDNDAIDLDFRVLGALLGGRDYYPRPNQRLRGIAGVALTEERSSGSASRANSELVIGGIVDWYQFSSPELDLTSSLLLYPSITDFGRLRSQFDVALRWEIYEDLFWRLSFYHTFDSDPPARSDGGSSVRDNGVTMGLGWTW